MRNYIIFYYTPKFTDVFKSTKKQENPAAPSYLKIRMYSNLIPEKSKRYTNPFFAIHSGQYITLFITF